MKLLSTISKYRKGQKEKRNFSPDSTNPQAYQSSFQNKMNEIVLCFFNTDTLLTVILTPVCGRKDFHASWADNERELDQGSSCYDHPYV